MDRASRRRSTRCGRSSTGVSSFFSQTTVRAFTEDKAMLEAQRRRSSAMVETRAGSWRIDVHHHVLPPQFVDSTPMPVRVPAVEEQLAGMEDLGIRAAITSLTP